MWNNIEKIWVLVPKFNEKGDAIGYAIQEEKVINVKSSQETTYLRFKYTVLETNKRHRINMIIYSRYCSCSCLNSEGYDEFKFGDLIVCRSSKEDAENLYKDLVRRRKIELEEIIQYYKTIFPEEL